MTAPADTRTPEAQCEHAIRNLFELAMHSFLKAHPTLLEQPIEELVKETKPLHKLCADVIDCVRIYAATVEPQP